MRSKLGFASIAVCTLILSAVSATPLAAAPPADACSLLTQAQVDGALGISAGSGQHIANGAPLCGWGKTGFGGKRVVLSIYTRMGSRTPVDRFNAAKNAPVKGVTKTPVSGVGDDAVFVTTPGFGTGLLFRKGSSAFELRVYGFPLDQIQAKEKTLALNVIGKI